MNKSDKNSLIQRSPCSIKIIIKYRRCCRLIFSFIAYLSVEERLYRELSLVSIVRILAHLQASMRFGTHSYASSCPQRHRSSIVGWKSDSIYGARVFSAMKYGSAQPRLQKILCIFGNDINIDDTHSP